MDFYLVAGTEELETRLACEVCDVVVSVVVVVVDVGFNGAAVCARLIRGRLEHPVGSIQNVMLQFLPYCVYNSELGLMSLLSALQLQKFHFRFQFGSRVDRLTPFYFDMDFQLWQQGHSKLV